MSDTISRQAAIETVKKHYRVDNDLLEVIAYEIEALPPAQSGCEDAVYRKAVQMLLAYFVPEERYAEAVDGLRRLPPAQPWWIPCSTALPSKYDNYLITTEDGMVVFGVYDPREKQWCRYDSIKSWWLYGIKVLAWMPLPKPYREGGQE